MENKKFDPVKLERLNNPQRYIDMPPSFIWEKLNLNTPDVIVDIGAGTGYYSIPFAQKFTSAKIYACDISKIMINWMEDNICNEHKRISPLLMDENSVNLAENSADLVNMFFLHHELKSPEKMLAEVSRILKPAAKIAIADWKKVEMESGPSLSIRYATDEVKKHLESAGFENVEVYSELEKHYVVIATNKK